MDDMPKGRESGPIERVFKTNIPRRDKFLSRLFGLFSEEVVRTWCAYEASPYSDLGRPTLRDPSSGTWSTLDFTFQRGEGNSRKVFAGELKCELEYNSYKYLRLADPGQLAHHTGQAFQLLRRFAADPQCLNLTIAGKAHRADGAILVWGAITDQGRDAVMEATGLTDVLSVEAMIADLNKWKPEGWARLINDRRQWSNALFDYLDGT